MLADHDFPCSRISILKKKPLGIWSVGHDGGIFPLLDGAIDVRAHDKAVIHRDRNVPVDCHSVARFGAVSHGLDFIHRRNSLNVFLMRPLRRTLLRALWPNNFYVMFHFSLVITRSL